MISEKISRKGLAKILLAVIILSATILAAAFVYADSLSISTDKQSYKSGEKILVTITTRPSTNFIFSVSGSSGVVYSLVEKTYLRGQYFVMLTNITEEGVYSLALEAGNSSVSYKITIGSGQIISDESNNVS